MRNRLRAWGAIAALAGAAACDLDVAPLPPIPPVDVSIDFCSDDIPVWVAYQQRGEDWVQVNPDASGTVSFSAEYRVALAFVHQIGDLTRTELIYTTSNVLEAVSGRACREETGTKTLTGSVTGFSGSQIAHVSMGVASVNRAPGQNTFTFGGLPSRPLDVLASRMSLSAQAEHANRTILRRSQNLVSTIPQLDFNAAEAITPTTATLAVSALNPDDLASATSNFFSQLETTHLLTHVEGIGNGNVQVEALPTSLTADGEYHEVFVLAESPAGHTRGAERFFRTPGTHSLLVGPELADPVVTTIATTPYLRVRTQVTRQSQYPSVISVQYDQELPFSANRFILTITSGYLGSSAFTWDMPMDDMSEAPGWQNSWGLQNGAFTWRVTGYGARSDLLLGGAPQENDLVRFAIRSSEQSAFAQRSATAPRLQRPPRPFTSIVRGRREPTAQPARR